MALSSKRRARATPVGVAFAAAVAISGLAACRGDLRTNLERLEEARQLAADVRIEFSRTVDAGNRAVMADTDETSAAFVHEAEKATNAVEHTATVLAPLLREMSYTTESGVLEQFERRFAEFRALDRGILALAVENSNLKAQRLSFGDGQKAADDFQTALQRIAPATKAGVGWQIEALIASSVAAVREVQVLQAPHIAESDDGAMTKLEDRAEEAERSARHSLDALARLVRPSVQSQLKAASDALDRFSAVNAQIVVLSRRNSNVRSLALSLGQKRTLAATCEESLRTLQDALAARGFTGTR